MIGVSLAAAQPSADKARTEFPFSAAQSSSSPLPGQGVDPFMALMLSLLTDWQAPAQPALIDKKQLNPRLDLAVEPLISIPPTDSVGNGEPEAVTDSVRARSVSDGEPGPPIDSINAGSVSDGGTGPPKDSVRARSVNGGGTGPPMNSVRAERVSDGGPGTPSLIRSGRIDSVIAASQGEPEKSSPAPAPMERLIPHEAIKTSDASTAAHSVHSVPAGYVDAPRAVKAPDHTAAANNVHQHLSEPIDQLREAGRHEAHLTIHPGELGPVHVHVEMDGPRLSIHFAVHSDDAKTALEQQLDPLRIRFEQMGLSLGQFDVRKDGGSHREQDDGSFLPVGQRGAVLARKPYFRVANSSGRVDVIA
jgi:flagellar hook-length control protein FliK